MMSIAIPRLIHRASYFRFTVPASKSIANRALILAALRKGRTYLKGSSSTPLGTCFEAEDIQLMMKALRKLGITVENRRNGVVIENDLSWQERADRLEIFVGNSGTCMRFLASLVILRKGTTVLRGVPRMHERPIADLVDALRQIGGRVQYLKRRGFPPIRVHGMGRVKGGKIVMKGNVSSQFVSSILLVGAAFSKGLTIEIQGELISEPYVDMTIQVLKKFRVRVTRNSKNQRGSKGFLRFALHHIPLGSGRNDKNGIRATHYSRLTTHYSIEGDASAAVYWWAFGIMHGTKVTVSNVPRNSIQPDAKFPSVAKALWQGKQKIFNMSEMPDASLMLMGMAAARNARSLPPRRAGHSSSSKTPQLGRDDRNSKPVIIIGIGSLRVKECDRIEAMATELRRIGAKVKTGKDWIMIWPIAVMSQVAWRRRDTLSGLSDRASKVSLLRHAKPCLIHTYHDHRIAMSFAILATKIGALDIENPDSVRKSYPQFWNDLLQLSRTLE